jgi:hypothetical protein
MLARFYAKNPSYADKTFISVKGGVNMKAHKCAARRVGIMRARLIALQTRFIRRWTSHVGQ